MERQPGAWIVNKNGELEPDMNDQAMSERVRLTQIPVEITETIPAPVEQKNRRR